MFRTFDEIETYLRANGIKKRVALAGSDDEDSLSSLVYAHERGIIDAILVGDEARTRELLAKLGADAGEYEFVPVSGGASAAHTACELVKIGRADLPMKGHVQTAEFMRAVLDKSLGLFREGRLLSQATVLEFKEENRLLIISDCAINIAPDYKDKLRILKNAVALAQRLGIETPKAAILAPLEMVNPSIPCTIEAAMLSKAAQRGLIKGCTVDGPLALDNAISVEAARCKGIDGPVAGHADILIVPELTTGNVLSKSLHYFAHLKSSGSVCGAECGVIMTSRSDSAEDKYCSILVAVLQICAN